MPNFYPGQEDYLEQLNSWAAITNVYYLGAHASDPTVDNNGDALITGALYWNTGAPELRVYNGSSWSALPSGTYAALAGSSSQAFATAALTASDKISSSKASAAANITDANSSLKLYDASLGAGLFGMQTSGSPYSFQLQVADSTMASKFPLSLNQLGGQVLVGPGGLQVAGTLNTTSSATFGDGTIALATYIKGTASGTGGGVSLNMYNGATGIFALGNKSGILGGAYDATPYLYTNAAMSTSAGMNIGGDTAVAGALSATGNASLGSSSNGVMLTFCGKTGVSNDSVFDSTLGDRLAVKYSGSEVASFLSSGVSVTGIITPEADNTRTLGTGALRWSTVYAGTGAINTSDAREKTAVRPLTDAEIAAAKQLAKEVGAYQWLESIAEKGIGSREHIGMTVQRAIEIFTANGLDPFKYGCICYDKWDDAYENYQTNVGEKVNRTKQVEQQVVVKKPIESGVIELIDGVPVLKKVQNFVDEPQFTHVDVKDENGNIVMVIDQPAVAEKLDDDGNVLVPASEQTLKPMTYPVPIMETVTVEYEEDAEPVYQKKLTREAGDRYSFRMDELLMFIARGFEARLTELESKS